jgi:hypothetical protein
MNPADLLFLGPLPGAIALTLLLLATLFITPKSEPAHHPAAHRLAWLFAALAVGIAYLPADFRINNFPGWWPKDATVRFQAIALASTALVALASLALARMLIAAAAALLASASLWAALETLHPRYISTAAMALHLICAAFLAAAAVLAPPRDTLTRVSTPAALLIPALAAGPVLFFAHNASFAQQTGPLVAAIVAWLLCAFFRRTRPLPSAAIIAPFAVLFIALLAASHQHSAYPVHFSATITLALALLTPAAARLPIKHRQWQALLPILLSLTLSSAAVLIAFFTKVSIEPYAY